MTIRHIKIFLAVCDCGCNATRAAKRLHMTQPAVSLAIRELEECYAIRLFDRLGRRLSLTDGGRRLREYGLRITALFDDMERELRGWDQPGGLRVGASMTIGTQFLPRYLKTLSARHPKAEIRAAVAPAERLEEKLLANELDLALTEGAPHHPALCAEEYMEDHLAVLCPRGAFRPGQTLSLEEFGRQDFLLRERGSGTREEFERVAGAAGLSIQPRWEAASTTALVNAVAAGLGIAVLPFRLVQRALEENAVVQVRVAGLEFGRRFRILYHKDKYLSPLARELMELCRQDGRAVPDA